MVKECDRHGLSASYTLWSGSFGQCGAKLLPPGFLNLGYMLESPGEIYTANAQKF